MEAIIKKDLTAGTFEVSREYAAPLAMVWRAFTDPEILDQWWAPKPWRCQTKSMDFEVGGKWHYEMIGPAGERHGGIQVFGEIVKERYFSGKDAFADSEGKIDENLPVATWTNTFSSTATGTKVVTLAQYPNPEALDTILKMGMEEGLQTAQKGLDEVLANMRRSKASL